MFVCSIKVFVFWGRIPIGGFKIAPFYVVSVPGLKVKKDFTLEVLKLKFGFWPMGISGFSHVTTPN